MTNAILSHVTAAAVARQYPGDMVMHVQVSRNFGVRGGWLRCETWCFPSGDPTGHTSSRIEYPGESS